MRRKLAYDLTRLVTRIFARTPNGIDRVDFALAECALAEDDGRAGLILTPFGPRAIAPPAAREALANIRKHWGEDGDPDSDAHGAFVLAALAGTAAPAQLSVARRGQYGDALAWMRRHGVLPGEPAASFFADGGVYLNVSQFPLSVPFAFRWLDRNARIDSVFFIHDLLPLETPEFFRPAERRRHLTRLRTVAAHGRAAIVSSDMTRQALAREMTALGRADLPIFITPFAPDPAFAADPGAPVAGGAPYFVMIGTIEPRKNHLMILHVWREIVGHLGAGSPKLVLIGERGWENEQVMDLIERCPALEKHVVLASGLATPSVRRLLMGARALLAPSFAEGYGLPVIEGLAAGAPVLASDIPVFRAIAPGRLKLIDPIDGPGWRAAILECAGRPRPTPLADPRLPTWPETFDAIADFLDALPMRTVGERASALTREGD